MSPRSSLHPPCTYPSLSLYIFLPCVLPTHVLGQTHETRSQMLQSFSQFLPSALQLGDPHARTATPALEENKQLGLGHPTSPTSPLRQDTNAHGAVDEASELRKKVKKEKPANEVRLGSWCHGLLNSRMAIPDSGGDCIKVFDAMLVMRAQRAIPSTVFEPAIPFRELGHDGLGAKSEHRRRCQRACLVRKPAGEPSISRACELPLCELDLLRGLASYLIVLCLCEHPYLSRA